MCFPLLSLLCFQEIDSERTTRFNKMHVKAHGPQRETFRHPSRNDLFFEDEEIKH